MHLSIFWSILLILQCNCYTDVEFPTQGCTHVEHITTYDSPMRVSTTVPYIRTYLWDDSSHVLKERLLL